MEEFRITIASPPDREHLVAEILVDNIQLAEINQETETILTLEIYPRPDGKAWQLKLDQVLTAIEKAKQRLIGS